MKKLIIAMSVIAIAFGSCQKHNITPSTEVNSDLLPASAKYYCNGQPVTHQSDITNYNAAATSIVITDQLDGVMSYYYFDNATMSEAFVNQHAELSALQAKIEQSKTIRAYAVSIGEEAYLTQNGKNSEAFTAYMKQYKTRAYPFALFNGTHYTGGSWGVTGPTPVLAPGINNLSNSMRSGSGLPINQIMFDLPFFNPAAGSVFIMVAAVPVLGGFGWANRISSVG